MDTRDLLPGVTTSGVEPTVVCDSAKVVRRARQIALVRDAAQLLLLIGVDALFIRWPAAHVPLASRATSVELVVALNALTLLHVWLSRVMPRWSARRIAATWCAAERTRLRLR